MKINNYEIMIAWRFLIKGRLQTLFIILGIAMGVAVQFFLSSLIGGLQKSIIERTVGSAPHLIISPEDRKPAPIDTGSGSVKEFRKAAIEERPEIFSWQQYVLELKKDKRFSYISPVANGNGFVLEGSTVHPVRVKGLYEPDGPGIYRIKQKLIAGKERFSGETALVAKELADKLALVIGDKFILRNDRGENVSLIAGGIFDLGTATGSSLVVLSLDRVRAFFSIDGVSAIEAQVKDVFEAEAVAQRYSRYFTRVKIESWQKTNKEMLAALSSQSSSSYTIQFFVLFSISLGIASVLAISAVQKSRQLGILKAMGATDISSAKIFVVQGFILGAAGSVTGIGIGYGISTLFIKAMGDMIAFGLEIKTLYIVLPVVLAIIASTLASAIPASRASRLSPIEVIRNG
ncbi:MAG: ABC transporter permease [Deltaproteobacteria bacterium]|nr:ABC transporter permease [Deltaproteobacteria bacterium]